MLFLCLVLSSFFEQVWYHGEHSLVLSLLPLTLAHSECFAMITDVLQRDDLTFIISHFYW